MKVMDFEIFTDDLGSIDLSQKKVINTINAHSYITSKSDTAFRKALHDSDILLPDGSGIVLAAKHVNNVQIKKIAGEDLHKFLLNKMNKQLGRVFYMGSSETTLDKITNKINKEYPNIIVDSYSPPFKNSFIKDENYKIINKINSFRPDVLFIGMTAPKQEKWLDMNKNNLNFQVACSIGAVFDFYAETNPRPNIFVRNMIGEAIPRFIKNPFKMWRRVFISIPLFLIEILSHRLNLKNKSDD